jgi:hypothetical protein
MEIPTLKMSLKKSNTLQKDSHTVTYELTLQTHENSNQAHEVLPTYHANYASISCCHVAVAFTQKQ